LEEYAGSLEIAQFERKGERSYFDGPQGDYQRVRAMPTHVFAIDIREPDIQEPFHYSCLRLVYCREQAALDHVV
jgi:hypothetical protein